MIGGTSRRRLSVYCLGRFRIELDHRPVVLELDPRARGILQYLIVHRGREVSGGELRQVFGPGPAAPGASLGGVPAIVAGARGDRLSPDLDVTVDAEEMEDLVAEASALVREGAHPAARTLLRSAIALYAGPAFEGEEAAEGWAAARRRGLHATHLAALTRLADLERRDGDTGSAIAVCLRALAFEPAHEEAHRLLMRCYWQAGLRAAAVRQLALCERAMAAIGREPSDETRSLDRLIRESPEPGA